MNAFLTGSHAYGTPTDKSDIDLVALVDQRTFDTLCKLLVDPCDKPTDQSGGNDVSASIRVGKLNLILHTSTNAFDAWAEGTDELIMCAPVTREEAVQVLKQKFQERWIAHERACP